MSPGPGGGDSPRPWVLLTLSLLVGTAYAATFSKVLTEDSIDYATSVVRGGFADLLHPHHLVYNLMLAGMTHSVHATQATAGTLHFLQAINLAATLIAIALFFTLLRAVGCSGLVSFGSSLLLALTNGLWRYSSQIEVYNWAVLWITATLLCLVLEQQGRRVAGLIGPVSSAMGMLFHQSAIFFTLAITVYAIWVGEKESRKGLVLRYVALPLCVVGMLYWGATFARLHRLSPGAVLSFATSYAHSGWWGKVEEGTLGRAASGFVNSILAVEGVKGRTSAAWAWAQISTFPLGGALLLLAARWRLRVPAGRRSLLTLCVPWVVAQALFATWWYPDNVEFWIVLLPGLALVFAMVLQGIAESPGARRGLTGALAILVAGEVSLNAASLVAQQHAPNRQRDYALQVCAQAEPNDLIVTTGQGSLGSYLKYFCSARVVAIHGYFGMRSPEESQAVTPSLEQALERIFQETLDHHGTIILDADVATGRFDLGRDLTFFRVDDFLRWLRHYPWVLRKIDAGDIYVLAP